jgi:Pentapeptide repeats (8 copies)
METCPGGGGTINKMAPVFYHRGHSSKEAFLREANLREANLRGACLC